jgi:hypothetical protein
MDTTTFPFSWKYHLGTLELSDFSWREPAKIAINGKQYYQHAYAVSTTTNEVVAITYNNKRFTLADSWPEPITDRLPTKEDGDDNGLIQYLEDGSWSTRVWVGGSYCLPAGAGWAHTPNWKPTPIDKKTLTIRDLKEAMRDGKYPDHDTLQSAIELLEATC